MMGAAEIVPVRPAHRFDEAALAAYLRPLVDGFDAPFEVQQFQGGQSNPTYHIATRAGAYVLRKQPAGVLLPSAHAVDREYRIMATLAQTEVPVPRVRVLCRDPGVIGQMFYVMDHVPGRVFADRCLPGVTNAERAAMISDMNRVLAALHRLDWRALGLTDFGRPEGYMARQIARWSRQFAASAVDVPHMAPLAEWLAAHVPPREQAAIAHGDYRLGNLLFHPTEPRVVAVLDWELATIGHPLSDLAYSCLTWRMPPSAGGVAAPDQAALGMPTEAAHVAQYCQLTGRAAAPEHEYMIIFNLFRLAAILAGVYRRALDGNAADDRGLARGAVATDVAACAWALRCRLDGR
jgi:aminoglycoside phosphotransferase (APT) family kinase protein